MTVWIIIPVRPFDEGKSRLADVLPPVEREAFNKRMFTHVLRVATKVVAPEYSIVVSRSPEARDMARSAGVGFVEEQEDSLNAALTQASGYVQKRGASSVLSLSTDLPSLEADDIRALLDAAKGGSICVIAPDHAGLGTNALLLSPPSAIPYLYGDNSASAHRRTAEMAGLRVAFVRRPGLAHDIDTEQDYRAFA